MSNVVVITGASRGLGLALSKSVPFEARVIDVSRSGPPPGSSAEHLSADLADPKGWESVGSSIGALVAQEQPRRAVLIHNAGTLHPIGFAGEVESDSYRRNVLLNSAAGQVLGAAFLRAVEGRDGRFDLVMITSGAASNPYPGWSSYGAGKASLDQWVRTVGAEQSIRGGVRVIAVAPGVLDTDMQRLIREQKHSEFPDVERFRQMHTGGNLVGPDYAAARLWDLIESGPETGSVLDLRDL